MVLLYVAAANHTATEGGVVGGAGWQRLSAAGMNISTESSETEQRAVGEDVASPGLWRFSLLPRRRTPGAESST